MKSSRLPPGVAVEGKVSGHGPGEVARIPDPAGIGLAGTSHAEAADRILDLVGRMEVPGHIGVGRSPADPTNQTLVWTYSLGTNTR